MQTLSSASRTCIACASASECTATVAMPISLHALWIRSAISPRLAMRIFSNNDLLDDDQRLAELDRLRVVDQDGDDDARARRVDRVHRFHRLDDRSEERRVGKECRSRWS